MSGKTDMPEVFKQDIVYDTKADEQEAETGIEDVKSGQKMLEGQNILLRCVNEVASKLLASETEDFPKTVWECLGVLGRDVGVNRVYICKLVFSDDAIHAREIYKWERDGDGFEEASESKPCDCFNESASRLLERLSVGKCVNYIASEADGEAARELEKMGVVSMFAVPVFSKNELWGYICFADDERERRFLGFEEDALRFAGKLIAAAMQRHISHAGLVSASEEALSRARAIGNFLANMSREIRTPMNAILGMSHLLGSTQLDEAQKGYLKGIHKASDSLLNIVNDLIDFTNIDTNTFEISSFEYDLVELVSDVTGLIYLRAAEKDLDFVTDIDPSMPGRLIGDHIRIRQIFTNLLSNAVKFTDSGGVSVKISYENTYGDDIVLSLSVEDTGSGIREEELPHLFTAFSQLDTTRKKNYGDTGLGLAISKGFAVAMGGDIEVSSEFGNGARFTLKIPQQVADASPIANIQNPEKKRVLILGADRKGKSLATILESLFISHDLLENPLQISEYTDKTVYSHLFFWGDFAGAEIEKNIGRLGRVRIIEVKDLSDMSKRRALDDIEVLFEPLLITNVVNILKDRAAEDKSRDDDLNDLGSFKTAGVRALVVDDNEINLIVAQEIIQYYDIEVETAFSGPEAIGLCKEKIYDIIFMDQMMPEMDGIQTTAHIRELGGHYDGVPVIALTANAASGNKDLFLQSRMDDYLEKPIDIDELNDILLKWLPRNKIIADAPQEQTDTQDEPDTPDASDFTTLVATTCGISAKDAMRQVGGSETVYITILKTFCNGYKKRNESLQKMASDQSWNNFRIEIHSQKSTLYNIGARDLSETARKLEIAAEKGNHAFIADNLDRYAREIDLLGGSLSGILPGMKPDLAKEPATQQQRGELCHAADRILICIEELENDDALKEITNISRWSYDPRTDEILREINDSIENFDYDSATRLIESEKENWRRAV